MLQSSEALGPTANKSTMDRRVARNTITLGGDCSNSDATRARRKIRRKPSSVDRVPARAAGISADFHSPGAEISAPSHGAAGNETRLRYANAPHPYVSAAVDRETPLRRLRARHSPGTRRGRASWLGRPVRRDGRLPQVGRSVRGNGVTGRVNCLSAAGEAGHLERVRHG